MRTDVFGLSKIGSDLKTPFGGFVGRGSVLRKKKGHSDDVFNVKFYNFSLCIKGC